ncbi:MAG: protease modulator HflC [Dongiaceae bacterium]
MNKLTIILVLIVAAVLVINDAFFTISQAQQALVFQFGQMRREVNRPGLHVKTPFIQDVMYFDRRLLSLEPPETSVTLSDKLRIEVSAFARYRITDPLRFYTTSQSEVGLNARLGPTINTKLRNELAKVTLTDLLSSKRDDIMDAIHEAVRREGNNLGIDIIDVRIVRTELPGEVSQSTFARMRAERERQARELRAQGAEASAQIRAEAEKDRTLILAEAGRKSEILRGEGDAERTKILGAAYSKDPKFFEFYRSLQAYKSALGDGNTTFVISPDNDFFRHFQQSGK